MKITKDFWLSEYFNDYDYARLGETRAQWIIDKRIISTMQYIRETLGHAITINSGYRSSAYNRKIGGSEYSLHTMGRACDFVVAGMKSEEVRKWILNEWDTNFQLNKIKGIELGISWVHIDFRNSSRLEKFYPK